MTSSMPEVDKGMRVITGEEGAMAQVVGMVVRQIGGLVVRGGSGQEEVVVS